MRSWIASAAAAASIAALVPPAPRRGDGEQLEPAATSAQTPAPRAPSTRRAPPVVPPLSGVALDKLEIREREVIAPGPLGRTAHLTLDPVLEREAAQILRRYDVPEAAIVLLDTSSGRVLVWASHVRRGPSRDLCGEATAPAASIFKIVTGAALVEKAGLSPETTQCYSGGESRLVARDLVDDPKRDRWCVTLAQAMGRSVNTVFARLAARNLSPADLGGMAAALGFGAPIPFDVPVAPSEIHLPEDALGFARTAAGFWNTTLSPLEAASLASTVANQGELLRPVIIDSVTDQTGLLYRAPARAVIRRAMRAETASAITLMMEETVANGTSYHAFHDPDRRAFLPNISVAGKTGTLARSETGQLYTWFVGFAPSRAPEVAIAALVVNSRLWRVKANVVARELLQTYFASKHAAGVTAPRARRVTDEGESG